MNREQKSVLTQGGLQALLDVLRERGYRMIGPTLCDGAIVYDDIDSIDDLPRGWTDEQDRGHYRLVQRDDKAMFGYAVGPHSWKKYLQPPTQRLWRTERKNGKVRIEPETPSSERLAFVGVRACELHAMQIQDRVLIGGDHVDLHYRARREGTLIVALNCSVAGGTCFCDSMGTGPEVANGFDLALTELAGDGVFVVEAGSEEGRAILADLPRRDATDAELESARGVVAATASTMGRMMPDADSVPALLLRNLDHPRWDDVADRCLACANCTMVCPTCFCTTVEDASDLAGTETTRTQYWDSCFTMDFSYVHGGSVRASGRARYRQWMTHKLATWVEQFGTSGCVGCGRCITWCPVGIDITEEVQAIRESEATWEGRHGD